MKNAFLIGEKIFLRAVDDEDFKNIRKWLSDEEFTKLLFQGDTPKNLEQIKEEFKNHIDDKTDIVFSMIDKDTKEHVGWAGIYEINWPSRNGEIRFFVGEKKYWKKGFATDTVSLLINYAFKKLNLHRIHGGANSENIASLRVFQKLGFEQEGISKEGYFRNGKYYDLIHFGLINKDDKH